MTLSDLDKWLSVSRAVQIRLPFPGWPDVFVRVYAWSELHHSYRAATYDPANRDWGFGLENITPREHVADWLERGSARVVPLYFDRFDLEQALPLDDGGAP